MTDERDEIRHRINLVDLVQSSGVNLKPYGKQWRGLCPFHQDKNPSFNVNGQTGRYKCWACGESGDIFTWVMKTQNMDFVEALNYLAKQAGITLSTRSGPSAAQKQSHDAAMEESNSFFREQLSKSNLAKEYCRRRGLDDETLNEWEIGFAPEIGEALAMHLKRKGFLLNECESLFLVQQDSGGGYFDKFRSRLMFPIRDERGILVAFGGRLLGDGNPKYINSGDTPIYRKSRVLYGLNRAKDRLQKDRRIVLCEGYLDVIACHRSGVRGAVASLGTSLTEDHAKLMKRWADEVVILYDSDNAGQKAAQKAVGILAAENLKVKVALMPPGDDPDTLLRSQGPSAVSQAVERGLSPLDYAIQALEARLKPESEDFWIEAVEILSHATNDLELLVHIDRLAGMYPGTRDVVAARAVLRKQIGQARKAQKSLDDFEDRPGRAIQPAMPKMTSAEVVLFNALAQDNNLRTNAWMFITRASQLLSTGMAIQLGKSVADAFPSEPPTGPIVTWIHRLNPEELRQTYSDILGDLRAERLTESVLADTIQSLKNQVEDRQVEAMKHASKGDAEKQAILDRLKQRKRYEHDAKENDDSLF